MSAALTELLSLISAPDARALTEPVLRKLTVALESTGARFGKPRVLATRIALELPFGADDPMSVRDAVRAALAAEPIDVNVLHADGRRKALLIADMDSTIIQCECIDEIADVIGLKPKIAAITERAMRGELEFEPALRARVALLKGIAVAQLEDVWRERVRLMPGARTLVATMNANGAHTVLVSGGFTFFTERVAKAAGFAAHQANRLVVADGQLAGMVQEPVLGRAAKLAALEQSAAERGLSLDQTLAVGDGANDLAMIARAGLGVAFHAKPVVSEAAQIRIDHGDLTALLFLQGYRADQFAEE